MQNLIKIKNTEIQIKEYQGKRVCTLKDIDICHQRPEGTARHAFNRNKKRFNDGEDYLGRNTTEAKTEFGITAPSGLILITESGYMMLAKVFDDDLSWEVQRQLVNNYFRKPAPKKTMLEELNTKLVIGLKNADACKDNKKAFRTAMLENGKTYRLWLKQEKEWLTFIGFVKKEINSHKQQAESTLSIQEYAVKI